MPTREPREITESFRIERVLKSSRSGIVFRALVPASGEPVAIKLIPAPPAAIASASRARFVALAELLTLLQPPGFPPLRDFGFTPDGGAFLVMDFIEGGRLDRVADLAPSRAVAIMLPVLDALATLAAKGLHHGNISPDNVLVGSGEQVWVVGLGTTAFRPAGTLARAILDDEDSLFVAPECFAADGAIVVQDWRSDLYSSAAALCALLKAEVGPADAAAPAVKLPPAAAAGLRDPNELRTVLEHSLRRSPLERPASFDAVRDAFRRALGAPTAVPGGDRRSRRESSGVVSAAARPTAEGARTAAAPAPPSKVPARATAAPVAPAAAPPAVPTTAPTAGALAGPEPGWEEPEGAPAWLQESQFIPPQPAPRAPEAVPEAPHDDREDTNPVPLQRRAELPPKVQPVASAPAPTLGAPAPLPTPVLAPSAPRPASAAPPVRHGAPAAASAPPDGSAARPPGIQFDTPPRTAAPFVPAAAAPPDPLAATPAAPATPLPPPAAALRPDQRQAIVVPASVHDGMSHTPPRPRAVDGTPPTGSYEVPAGVSKPPVPAPAAAPAEPQGAPEAAAAAGSPGEAPQAAEPRESVPAGGDEQAAPAPKAPAPAPAKTRPRARGLRPLQLVVTAFALVLVAAGGIVGLRMAGSRQAPAPLPQPLPTRPRPTAIPQPTVSQVALESLLAAEEAAAAGDVAAAQTALAGISADDELSFGPAELGRLTGVRASVNRARRESILGDLQQGLANGNLRVVRDTLRRLTREDEAALAGEPDAAQTLEEARRAINLLNLATRAQQAGNNAQVLEHAAALVALAPRSSQAEEMREKAAAALERDAEVLAGRGQFELAKDRLETVARHWSSRPGLGQRIERIRAAEANDQKLAAVLAQAEQAAADRRPDRGLELLRSVTPPPYYEQRFRDARQQLEAVLREIDANPPGLDIPPTVKLEYSKNKPFILVVRITDDHAVKSAALFLRVKDTEHYKELALRRTQESEWSGEITTALHENKAVEFYVVATDHSGHTGQLGSPQQPLTLKKKWGIFGR